MARGPNGEEYCWWQCTVKGGREGRDLDAVELAVAAEALGAGEILLNCIDRDGTGDGFDLDFVGAVSSAVGIPVIASSGPENPRTSRRSSRRRVAPRRLRPGFSTGTRWRFLKSKGR